MIIIELKPVVYVCPCSQVIEMYIQASTSMMKQERDEVEEEKGKEHVL